MTTVLSATDSSFGVLSSNYTYNTTGLSLFDYSLTELCRVIESSDKSLPSYINSDPYNRYNGLLTVMKQRYLQEAMENVAITNEIYDSYGGFYGIAEQVKNTVMPYVLELYLKSHGIKEEEISEDETRELSVSIYNAYILNEITNVEFLKSMSIIELAHKTRFKKGDGSVVLSRGILDPVIADTLMTVSEYIDFMMFKVKNDISEKLVDIAFKHRRYWIENVPGFLRVLLRSDIDSLVAPDDDILESINIDVLKRYKSEMSGIVQVDEPSDDDIKVISHALKEIVNAFVSKSFLDSKGNKEYLTINNSNLRNILEIMFSRCNFVVLFQENMPDWYQSYVNGFVGFEDIDASIFWIYVLNYVSLYTDIGTTLVPSKFRNNPQIERKATILHSSKPREYTEEQKMKLKYYSFIESGDVTIYTKVDCQFCNDAKEMLDKAKKRRVESGVTSYKTPSYIEIVIESISDIEDQSIKKQVEDSGSKTVPIIVIDGDFIGGFDELQKIINTQIRPVIRT